MTTCPYCTSSLPELSATCPTCGASLASPALNIGAVIGGKYRVERVLGQGGFGITYLALDLSLDHRVAIKELFAEGSTRSGGKVIPPSGLDINQIKQKFLEEARTVQRFNHAGIVRVYGVFEGNQTAYMVMEALSGATLTADVLENGAFPVATVLELARQLCASLEIVHGADLLHRDIKPDNVFLSSDGRVVLIDFGSARGFAQGQVKRLTRLVTPGYAAPEQYASQAAFGTYTDVYGLAATLYYAVEGQMPPMATDLMLGERLEFRNTGQLQSGLEAGLKVKVIDRPQTVRDLLELLERPVVPRVRAVVTARVPAVAALLYDQNGISVSASEIVMQGKSLSVSKLEGYSVTKKVETKLPTQTLERISEVNALCIFIVIPIGFVFLLLSIFKISVFSTLFIFALIFFLINLSVIGALSSSLVDIFEMNFSLVFKGGGKRSSRELEFFKTDSLQESTQLEQALLKVIPKLP